MMHKTYKNNADEVKKIMDSIKGLKDELYSSVSIITSYADFARNEIDDKEITGQCLEKIYTSGNDAVQKLYDMEQYMQKLDSICESYTESESNETGIECGRVHVVLVDDDERITELWARSLRHYGFKATTFNRSVETLEAFKNNPGGFDIIITDENMPDMTGITLIKRIREINSDFPAILCTGYDNLPNIGILMESYNFLTFIKPIDINTLVEAIKKVTGKSTCT